MFTAYDPTRPYHLYGKDNVVLFLPTGIKQPIVVKGAGAGAEVTASGVFADINEQVNKTPIRRWAELLATKIEINILC